MGHIVERDVPEIFRLLRTAVGSGDVQSVARMGGLTNHTYHAVMEDGREYVVRIPGEGTEEMIVRSDEKVSTTLSCRLGIDAQMLYFGDDGSKVTEYIPKAVTMNAASFHDAHRVRQAAQIYRTLHTCGEDTGVPFEVFDMAAGYEKIIFDNQVPMPADYEEQKKIIMDIKAGVDREFPPHRVPCHNDPLCENWVVGGDRLYLIDWEYAGMNDGMWDLSDISIEAGFDETWDRLLLTEYLGHEPSEADMRHFLANKIYVDYLWTLWAKTRVPFDGQPMEDWAAERYARMLGNIAAFQALDKN
ncbi:MAG: phosphotransferase family protein [Lachnospiraceae bacterium]|nr:phosphotransferase family protein [Lachnospiraceae bacterium]